MIYKYHIWKKNRKTFKGTPVVLKTLNPITSVICVSEKFHLYLESSRRDKTNELWHTVHIKTKVSIFKTKTEQNYKIKTKTSLRTKQIKTHIRDFFCFCFDLLWFCCVFVLIFFYFVFVLINGHLSFDTVL